jgi:hypothetical protein
MEGVMATHSYLVVPFIGVIRGGTFSKENAQTVSGQLQAVIDGQLRQGWEFYSIEKVGIEVQPGCLGGLLGQKTAYINFDQIVFRRST